MSDDEPAPTEDWLAAYRAADGVNERYALLREEAKRLRRRARRPEDMKFTDDPAFLELLRELNREATGTLVVFAANDFGWPVALRPKGTSVELQRDVREALLRRKYESDDECDRIRRRVLEADPRVHKTLIARHDGDDVAYHLPGGWKEDTAFLTVREAIGLVDYITNGRQREAVLY